MKEAGVRQGPTLAGVWGRRRLPRPRRVRAGAQVVATPASSPSPIPTGVQISPRGSPSCLPEGQELFSVVQRLERRL